MHAHPLHRLDHLSLAAQHFTKPIRTRQGADDDSVGTHWSPPNHQGQAETLVVDFHEGL